MSCIRGEAGGGGGGTDGAAGAERKTRMMRGIQQQLPFMTKVE